MTKNVALISSGYGMNMNAGAGYYTDGVYIEIHLRMSPSWEWKASYEHKRQGTVCAAVDSVSAHLLVLTSQFPHPRWTLVPMWGQSFN